MTYSFHVGEPASTRQGPSGAPRPGEAKASSGPGGVQIVVALDDPGEPERRAVEDGPVVLGVRDRGGVGALLVQAGEPGRPGHVEATAPLDAQVAWWGADIELALCDRDGVVRAVRRFRGPMAGPVSAGPANAAVSDPRSPGGERGSR